MKIFFSLEYQLIFILHSACFQNLRSYAGKMKRNFDFKTFYNKNKDILNKGL